MSEDVLVTSERRLAEIIARARAVGAVALDTEFVWTRTYYPILGLVQVGWSEDEAYLVDTVAIQDLYALGALIADPSVVKILHDAQQDLTILKRATGGEPANIFDTRLACGFCDGSAAWGLGRLLEETLSIELAKTETRTDWVKRPLTDKQIEYALDDIKHLPHLREKLIEQVDAHGNLAWLEEEMRKYDNPALYEEKDPGEQYHRVKGAGRLKPLQLGALRSLAAWREITASEQDVPRNRVAPDELLLDIAQALPDSESSLRRVRTKYRKLIDRNARDLVQVLQESQDEELELKQGSRMDAATRKNMDLHVKRIGEELKVLCAGLHLDPIMVATRADMKAFVQASGDHDHDLHSTSIMSGWRRDAVGEDLKLFLET